MHDDTPMTINYFSIRFVKRQVVTFASKIMRNKSVHLSYRHLEPLRDGKAPGTVHVLQALTLISRNLFHATIFSMQRTILPHSVLDLPSFDLVHFLYLCFIPIVFLIPVFYSRDTFYTYILFSLYFLRDDIQFIQHSCYLNSSINLL